MSDIEKIKTWAALLKLITTDHYQLTKKEVALKILGIAEKSYFDILRGKIPKDRLIRQISGVVKDLYNAEISAMNGTHINIKKFISINGNQNIIRDTQSQYPSPQKEKQIESLLNRIVDLEDEIKSLKEKLKRKK